MSHDMVDWAIAQNCKKASAKSVLICLAYRHNGKTGLCCPSIPQISSDTQLERKTILAAISKLEEMGLIIVDRTTGKSSSYRLKPVPKTAPLDKHAPVPETGPVPKTAPVPITAPQTGTKNGTGTKSGTSAENGTEPVPKTAPGSAENGTRNKELTRKEQGNKKIQSVLDELDFSVWPEIPTKKIFLDWLQVRKSKGCNPVLTQTVVDRLDKTLRTLMGHGMTVDDIFGEMVERNWQSIKPDWVLKDTAYQTKSQDIEHEQESNKQFFAGLDPKITEQLFHKSDSDIPCLEASSIGRRR